MSFKDKYINFKEMDFSLFYIFLWNICNIMFFVNNWGDILLIIDCSIGVCIDRIRVKRNVLFVYVYIGLIDKDSFEYNWCYFKKNIVNIGKECNIVEKYEKKVDELYICVLNLLVIEKCFEIIMKM